MAVLFITGVLLCRRQLLTLPPRIHPQFPGVSPPHQCDDQICNQKPRLWNIDLPRNEQGLKKVLYNKAMRKAANTAAVPIGERLYWAKVPIVVSMESEVCTVNKLFLI